VNPEAQAEMRRTNDSPAWEDGPGTPQSTHGG
jgi:hypothetical protein